MSATTSIPLVMTAQGPVATSPASLQQALISNVAATNPGYTASLPGSLIEDISSTDVGALTTIDQARVDAINDVTPYGANAYVLTQLGQQFGIPQGQAANGSVLVVFSGSVGYVIAPGFVISDGTNQYTVQSPGGVIQTGGSSAALTAVAISSGTFAIPANTVNQVVTSVPSGYTVTVNNPNAGTAATAAQTIQSYRAQVLQAGLVTTTGTLNYLKTLLQLIPGVQPYLISVIQRSGGFEIICGGGDSYAVATAIINSGVDFSTLLGSQLAIAGITAANPAVFTTNLNNNFVAGNTFTITGATPSAYNGTYTVASSTATTITTTTNSSGFGTYVSGAIFSPNPRNVTVAVFVNPDAYSITYVNPPQQTVLITATWNTTLTSFTAGSSVNQLAAPALTSYINSIPVGAPINELEMTAVFQAAVVSVLPTINLTTLTFSVTINGILTPPTAGTSLIEGDPESYFFCSATGATVMQG